MIFLLLLDTYIMQFIIYIFQILYGISKRNQATQEIITYKHKSFNIICVVSQIPLNLNVKKRTHTQGEFYICVKLQRNINKISNFKILFAFPFYSSAKILEGCF